VPSFRGPALGRGGTQIAPSGFFCRRQRRPLALVLAFHRAWHCPRRAASAIVALNSHFNRKTHEVNRHRVFALFGIVAWRSVHRFAFCPHAHPATDYSAFPMFRSP